jgi:hypothetical protein
MFKAIKEFFLGKPAEVTPTVVAAPYKVEVPAEVAPVVAKSTPKPHAKKPAEAKPVAVKKPAAPRKPRAKKTTA